MAESFSDLYVREDVVTALRNIGVTQPTVIQVHVAYCGLNTSLILSLCTYTVSTRFHEACNHEGFIVTYYGVFNL